MSSRSMPPTGGGAPMISASGISRPTSTSDLTTAPLALTLRMSPEAERAGRAVVALVIASCSGPTDEKAVDAVATLEFFFKEITRRVPEFHAFMDELVSTGRLVDVRRIIAEPGRRGRPRRFPSVIALIELVLSEHSDFSATKAVEWIDENLRGKGIPGLLSTGHMKNVYSDFRDLFALWSQSLYAPPDILTAWPWRSPDEEERLREKLRGFVATRVPGALILHDPEDEVGAPARNTFEALRPWFSPGEGLVVIVGAEDPEFGPYSGYLYMNTPMPGQRLKERWRFLTAEEIEKL